MMQRPIMGTSGKRKRENPGFYGFDWTLVFIVVVILIFGLIMLYSSSSYSAQVNNRPDTWYVRRQLVPIIGGLVLMVAVAFIPNSFWKKMSAFIYAVGFISVLMVYSPMGIEVNGARRWVDLGPFTLQPAEIIKIGVILMMAYLLCKWITTINDNPKQVFLVALVDFAAAGEIGFVTDDLGTAIIVFAMGLIMMIVANIRAKYIFIIIAVIVAAGALLLFSAPYRMDRVHAWMDLEAYSDTIGFQILQGLYAIGSGGLFGKGLGKSTQKLGSIPESQNDMIFSVICEELGIIGGIILIILIVLLILRMKKIYDESRDLYGKVVVAGVAGHIAMQTIINMSVVTNLIPNTGVPLPFISYGGTAILFQLIEVGLVLQVARENELKALESYEFRKRPEVRYRRRRP